MKLFFNVGIILFMFYFLFGYSSFSLSSDYEKIADKITEDTAKKLKAQKNLRLVGTGGQMMHDIQMMAMGFYYYQEVDLKTARELIIYAINEYLAAINSSKEIRSYLHEYPFMAKNIEIRIWVFEPSGSNPPLDKIYYISAINGNLAYYLDLPETYSRRAIREETYEEALQEIALNQEITEKVSQTKDNKWNENATIGEVVAKDGAKVNIKVTSFEDALFELNGEGFEPCESLSFISSSYDEVLYYCPISADKNGRLLPIGHCPAVKGKSKGVCHIYILRNKGSIHVQLPWATETLKEDKDSNCLEDAERGAARC